MRGMHIKLKNKTYASIGIGAIIIFIALVLVAGIAASVIIQSSTYLESRAYSTGSETTSEVATGISIYSIEGYTSAPTENISKLVFMIRPRSGTDEISLTQTIMELCNSTLKIILNYTDGFYSKPEGLDNIFAADVFPDFAGTGDGTTYGLLVMYDVDNSVNSDNPVINRGDKVCLCINATGVFGDIPRRTVIWGKVVPEEGYPGTIRFTTPSTYDDNVMELYRDI